jgi:hypothetical protein
MYILKKWVNIKPKKPQNKSLIFSQCFLDVCKKNHVKNNGFNNNNNNNEKLSIFYACNFYFKHGLSISLNLFCYRFTFKYLEMNFKFSFKNKIS